MTPELPQPRLAFGFADAGARAIETDRAYFEMGAQLEPLPGAVLAWMPGLTASPAGAVIHRVDPAIVAALGRDWLVEAERALARVGAGLARIYLDRRDPQTDALLRSAGYSDREELAFGHSLPDAASGMRLHPVRSDEDWERKRRFHQEAHELPDGHAHCADAWVTVERRKCAHGIEAYWAEIGDEVVGMISLVEGDGLLRLKNLVIHPAYRRRSVATALLSHAAAAGMGRNHSCQCVLAVVGGGGELLYRAVGMQVIGSQVEWTKPMGKA